MKQSIEINASADAVWEILGTQFGDLAIWANPVHESRMLQPDLRECVTSVGTVHEQVLAWDDAGRSFTYEAVVRPDWLRRGVNTWTVVSLGPTRCRVQSVAVVQVAPRAALRLLGVLPRLIRMSRTMDDLRVYAETGEVSSRKRAALREMTSLAGPVAGNSHPARLGLFANAAFSTLTGLMLLFDLGGPATILALPEALTRGTGAALLGFALVVLVAARRGRSSEILAISLADLGWVAGSAVWLFVEPFRWLLVGGAALCVFAVALAQLWGLREATRRRLPG